MSVTSTVPTVKARMVTQFAAALATAATDGGQLQCLYAWPGSNMDPESVFLGHHPEITPNIAAPLTAQGDLAAIKTGRKTRDEEYKVDVTIWTFRSGLTASTAQTVEARGFAVLALLENVTAADPTIGLTAGTIRNCILTDYTSALFPWGGDTGWASYIVASFTVTARLT